MATVYSKAAAIERAKQRAAHTGNNFNVFRHRVHATDCIVRATAGAWPRDFLLVCTAKLDGTIAQTGES